MRHRELMSLHFSAPLPIVLISLQINSSSETSRNNRWPLRRHPCDRRCDRSRGRHTPQSLSSRRLRSSREAWWGAGPENQRRRCPQRGRTGATGAVLPSPQMRPLRKPANQLCAHGGHSEFQCCVPESCAGATAYNRLRSSREMPARVAERTACQQFGPMAAGGWGAWRGAWRAEMHSGKSSNLQPGGKV